MTKKDYENYCMEATTKVIEEMDDTGKENGKTASPMMAISAMLFCTMMKEHLEKILESEGIIEESEKPIEEPTFSGLN